MSTVVTPFVFLLPYQPLEVVIALFDYINYVVQP